MKYYGKWDITEAYDISDSCLTYRIRKGKIEAHKLTKDRRHFIYVIPETELWKLESVKRQEPIPSPQAQPGYIDSLTGERRFIDDSADIKNPKPERPERSERPKGSKRFKRPKRKHVDYDAYIQSEKWQKVRRERFRLDGFKCQICGAKKNLQAHHRSYERLGQPGEVYDLITLCHNCHMMVHRINPEDQVRQEFQEENEDSIKAF